MVALVPTGFAVQVGAAQAAGGVVPATWGAAAGALGTAPLTCPQPEEVPETGMKSPFNPCMTPCPATPPSHTLSRVPKEMQTARFKAPFPLPDPNPTSPAAPEHSVWDAKVPTRHADGALLSTQGWDHEPQDPRCDRVRVLLGAGSAGLRDTPTRALVGEPPGLNLSRRPHPSRVLAADRRHGRTSCALPTGGATRPLPAASSRPGVCLSVAGVGPNPGPKEQSILTRWGWGREDQGTWGPRGSRAKGQTCQHGRGVDRVGGCCPGKQQQTTILTGGCGCAPLRHAHRVASSASPRYAQALPWRDREPPDSH